MASPFSGRQRMIDCGDQSARSYHHIVPYINRRDIQDRHIIVGKKFPSRMNVLPIVTVKDRKNCRILSHRTEQFPYNFRPSFLIGRIDTVQFPASLDRVELPCIYFFIPEAFFRTFLPALSADTKLFHFFLDPQTNEYSDEFIHLKFDDSFCIRTFLEMMVIEYAKPREDIQAVLQPMVLTLLMIVARQYRQSVPVPAGETLSDQIVRYIGAHAADVTLKDIAAHFSYHPNYISTLLHRETGKSFSELLLEQRMERAVTLLKGTDLSIEEIAEMLGYSNNSNFYKAFRQYYHDSPREYLKKLLFFSKNRGAIGK